MLSDWTSRDEIRRVCEEMAIAAAAGVRERICKLFKKHVMERRKSALNKTLKVRE